MIEFFWGACGALETVLILEVQQWQ